MQFTSARKLVNETMDDYGLTGQSHFKRFYRWLKKAVMDLGAIPEYNLKSIRVPIDYDCANIKLPDDVISLRRVFLCNASGNLTEAGYGGIAPKQIWDPDGGCAFYKSSRMPVNLGSSKGYSLSGNGSYGFQNHLLPALHQSYDVVLGLEENTLFFMAGDIYNYRFAVIEYNGFRTSPDGLIKVPQEAEMAVSSFMEYRQTQRDRRRDRSKVPQSEVQFDRGVWIEEFRRAYTQMKMPTKLFMDEWVLENWGMRLPVPKARISGFVHDAVGSDSYVRTEDSINGVNVSTAENSIPPLGLDPSVDPCIIGAPACPGIGQMVVGTTFEVGPCGNTAPEPEPECDGVCLVDCVAYEDATYRYVSCLEDPGNDTTKWVVNRYTKASPVVKTQATPTNNPTQYTKPTSIYLVQGLIYDAI